MRIQLIKTSNGFQPDSLYDETQLRSVHVGDVIVADVKQSRNPAHHRKGMKLIDTLFHNQDQFDNIEPFKKWLKIQIGFCDTLIGEDGKVFYTLKSFSFADTDQIEFDLVYQQIISFGYEKMGINAALDFA